MKKPLIFCMLVTPAILILSTAGHCAAEDRVDRARHDGPVRSAGHEAWDTIVNIGEATGDAVSEAVNSFMYTVRDDVIHERPELTPFPHLVVLRNQDDVSLFSCQPLVARPFNPKGARCSGSLHKRSFNLRQIQACVGTHQFDSHAARMLTGDLKHVIESKVGYTYHFLGKFGFDSTYKKLFRTCAKEIAAGKYDAYGTRPANRRPDPRPQPRPDVPAAPPAADEPADADHLPPPPLRPNIGNAPASGSVNLDLDE